MPKQGETLHSTSFETGFGGKGANQCIAAARLGCKAAMIGKIGSDPYGAKYKNQFEAEGVNTDFLEVAGDHSGVALIVVSADGENQIVINANANQYLSMQDVEKAKRVLDDSKVSILIFELYVFIEHFCPRFSSANLKHHSQRRLKFFKNSKGFQSLMPRLLSSC